jgi:hypothetical protein
LQEARKIFIYLMHKLFTLFKNSNCQVVMSQSDCLEMYQEEQQLRLENDLDSDIEEELEEYDEEDDNEEGKPKNQIFSCNFQTFFFI